MEYNLEKLQHGLESLKLSFSDSQLEQLLLYYEMLVEKNKVMNLTAITDYEEVVEKHFLDSLSLCQVLDLQKNSRILDLGTGAGFPGIPLKIAFPNLEMVLMDSLKKRVGFLEEVIRKLNLTHIEAIHGRAEEMAKKEIHREGYDICVSRAVANLSSLCEYCLPFVKVGGVFVSYKSGEIEEELSKSKKAIQLLGGVQKKVYKFCLPNTEISRSFVMIEKKNRTPKAFPRKAGTPSKEPLH